MEYIRTSISSFLNIVLDGFEVVGKETTESLQKILIHSIAENICSDKLMRLAEGPRNPTGFVDWYV